jgi:predicted metal-binding protein
MAPPVEDAMVFICEKCGKRADDGDKHASHKLASKFKRRVKREFGKGRVRIVLTSCMDACPDNRIAILFQSMIPGVAPLFLEADPSDIDGSAEALLQVTTEDVSRSN